MVSIHSKVVMLLAMKCQQKIPRKLSWQADLDFELSICETYLEPGDHPRLVWKLLRFRAR